MQNILIIVFLALSIVTYGCSDSTRAQNAPTNKEILIDNKISEVNSLIDSLRTELSSIKRSLEKQQSTIDKQKEEIKTLKEKKSGVSLIWIILVSTALILILLSIYFYITLKDIQNRLDRHRSDIEKIFYKMEEYKSKSYIQNSTTKPIKNERTENNDKYKPSEEKSVVSTKEVTKEETEPDKNIEETKEGYFGMLIGNSYFSELITSKNDNALFKAWVSDTDGEFTILSLDAIRSIDGIENAVYKEGVPIKDALYFKVIQNGKVKRNSKGNWNVVSPTKIKLS
ncbi:hypothetical protein [uncultured Bacteroides sp.]|uniref:hypothetical protein n=1 Tax=uncultured Bacteroides sp. TaxID=162156 RepID=UPI002592182B|nr:hypothetical protein [uncultured Bacteroides sp.]